MINLQMFLCKSTFTLCALASVLIAILVLGTLFTLLYHFFALLGSGLCALRGHANPRSANNIGVERAVVCADRRDF